MNSPVDSNFPSFIKIDRKKKEPVYMQIVYQFINAVQSKMVEEGDLLPGSRKISEALNVHRKTVIAAMSELQAQGWIQSVPNVGTFVKNPKLAQIPTGRILSQPPEKAPYLFRKELILDMSLSESQGSFYFTDGTPDHDAIDAAELVRFYAAVLKRKKRIPFLEQAAQSHLFFRDQLSFYLNLTRGLHLSRVFVLPISSREMIFSILARLFIAPGDVVLVGELSYFLPNMIFSQAGAKLKTIPLDEQGLCVDFIEENFRPGEIRFLYVNSLCHYPTTVKLSDQRKEKLLKLAQVYNFLLLEDDEDFEFSSLKARTDSLFRKNNEGRVIYMGGFGKFLNSSFQMGFLMAPKDVLEEARKYLNVFGRTDFMMEKALGEMIQQGDIFRYQRKSQKIIQDRKSNFAELLDFYFKETVTYSVPESGLAFWIVFKKPLSLVQLQGAAVELGLIIPKTCLYQNRSLTALRLGFAHLSLPDMEQALLLLHKAYVKVENNGSFQKLL